MSWDRNKIWGHIHTFPFGKHKGKSLGLVLETDPEYFLWLKVRVKDFKVTKGIMEGVYILTGLDNFELE